MFTSILNHIKLQTSAYTFNTLSICNSEVNSYIQIQRTLFYWWIIHCGPHIEITSYHNAFFAYMYMGMAHHLTALSTPYHDLLMTTVTREFPEAVRFVSHAFLDSYGVVIVD